MTIVNNSDLQIFTKYHTCYRPGTKDFREETKMAKAQPLTHESVKFKRKVRTSTQTVIGSNIKTNKHKHNTKKKNNDFL